MKILYDIYVLIETANKNILDFFMKKYMLNMEPLCDIFEYPRTLGSEIEFETNDYSEMLTYVMKREGSHYYFAFKSNIEDQDIKFVFISINRDGGMVLGIAVYLEHIDGYISQLGNDFKTNFVYAIFEQAPPVSSVDFKNMYYSLYKEE